MLSFQSMLTAFGIWPDLAALTAVPSYSSFERASSTTALPFFIADWTVW
jgi:hypothetical protein